jgi:hypothetical protein
LTRWCAPAYHPAANLGGKKGGKIPKLTFDPIPHKYAIDGNPAAHCTGVLSDLGLTPPYKYNPDSMDFGGAVHKSVHYDLIDILDDAQTSPILLSHLSGFREKKREMRIRLIAAELPVFDGHAFVAGTLDLLCEVYDGDLAIIDLKTGQPPQCVELQTAGYECMLRWMETWNLLPPEIKALGIGQRKIRRFSMYLMADRAIVTEYKDVYDLNAWRGAVALWKWKFARRKAA